jgi:AhpC/TSA family
LYLRVFAVNFAEQNQLPGSAKNPVYYTPLFPSSSRLIQGELITMKEINEIKMGEEAPDFTLPSHLGGSITLSELRGKNVVLAFYPAAFTPV